MEIGSGEPPAARLQVDGGAFTMLCFSTGGRAAAVITILTASSADQAAYQIAATALLTLMTPRYPETEDAGER